MTYKIVVADPAKNITLMVLNQVEDRLEASRFLMGLPELGAEQVGFVTQAPDGLWRLEMAGGEFCGNAARCFGLFVALRQGITGHDRVPIRISGMRDPLSIAVNTIEGSAEAAMPGPVFTRELHFQEKNLAAYGFDGITHLIAPDILPDREAFFALKASAERLLPPALALGVMFYNKERDMMTPAVYVYQTKSLVFESSCGSGSAALGLWRAETMRDGEYRYAVVQPGGIIEVFVSKQNNHVRALGIGGPVSLKTLSIPAPEAPAPRKAGT